MDNTAKMQLPTLPQLIYLWRGAISEVLIRLPLDGAVGVIPE
jgi:hypothetical protein